VSCIK